MRDVHQSFQLSEGDQDQSVHRFSFGDKSLRLWPEAGTCKVWGFCLWFGSWVPCLTRTGHGNTYVGRIFCVFQHSQACILGEMCGGAAGEKNWTFSGFGFLSVELLFFFFCRITFFLFKATNSALGCFPINQEYFFISAKLSLMLSCWWHMRSAKAGTLLRVLTCLSSIPRNSYCFSVGPRTDQCLLYINTILTTENCLIYLFIFLPLWSIGDTEAAADWQLIFLQWFAQVLMQMTCGFSAK